VDSAGAAANQSGFCPGEYTSTVVALYYHFKTMNVEGCNLMNVETTEGLGSVATNKAKVFAYIDPELKEGLEQLAERRNRSVSNLVETLIQQEIEKAKEAGELNGKANK